jgi:hypothetical protein
MLNVPGARKSRVSLNFLLLALLPTSSKTLFKKFEMMGESFFCVTFEWAYQGGPSMRYLS